ncbi:MULTISPECIES: 3',5'-cyclic-nucleotide phosphodiesterase [Gammaproteobacteria]|uniref:3',5'-cyclic-nucleotide phosphodiesterase n=1 Tax=Gammaproteobacteria TaxID=1236 RepID=UPI000DD0B596|nr:MULTISPECIES: 3',5'-cyclic-nucleotide phosphodiesterase [Gammaproteobacteria]RTE87729.1 3',5'-cyclic-nucleotide phosphodiesterase [Aliidiomarina sp. B3213]TCZ92489.1 3',5'-cyclic-nucleotide phosphodiesterase [Lysobacter sp. N42]
MFNIDVLGCSGGVGGSSGSTCLRVHPSILIDAGSGLAELSIKEMRAIRHIFITHAHMDHICHLPTFLSNLFDEVPYPIKVYAQQETIDVLKEHIFNWKIWPDFLKLPDEADPILEFVPLSAKQTVTLEGISFTPFEVEHTVPTFAYSVQDQDQHFVFSADTKLSQAVVDKLNSLPPMDTFMVECAFPDRYEDLADVSCHLTPKNVSALLQKLETPPKNVWITHLKPAYESELRQLFASDEQFSGWNILE